MIVLYTQKEHTQIRMIETLTKSQSKEKILVILKTQAILLNTMLSGTIQKKVMCWKTMTANHQINTSRLTTK